MAANGIDKEASVFSSLDKHMTKDGAFKRPESQYRNWISTEAGAEFPAEADRYHLCVSYACPWAHRTLIVRKLKGLEEIIPYTSVEYLMGDRGWAFATGETQNPALHVVPDPYHPKATHMRDIYFEHNPEYTGRHSVPLLYDTKQHKIVSNESAEIIHMMYHSFDHLLPPKYASVDLLPEHLKAEIEATNDWTYDSINNGVYRSGAARQQGAYETAVLELFTALDRVEAHLSSPRDGPYYHGATITEADVRLYPTISRFDPVYIQHFKCNIRDIRSGYPAIHKWLRRCYWNVPAFKETTEFEHIKKHYTKSHPPINPFRITPVGPLPDILGLDEDVNAVKAAKH